MNAITYQPDGEIARIVFDDGKANAQGPDYPAAMNEALDRAERERAGALLILGRPGFLSAGLNIKKLPLLDREALRRFSADYGRLLLRLFAFPRPVVTVATGHAIAGGALLLLCGDARVGAAGEYKIGLSEVTVGIALPAFALLIATHSLPAHVHARALLHGSLYHPEEAMRVGFFDEVRPAAEAVERGAALARHLAALPAAAYTLTKEAMRGAPARALLARADAEGDAFFDRLSDAFRAGAP